MDSSILYSLMAPPDLTDCRRILCIQPHPDDNEVGMGGTIAALAEKGCEVHYLTVTNGDLGSGDGLLSHAEIARVRSQELEAAGRSLGATVFHQLPHGDGTLEHIPALAAEIAEIIRTIQPDAVFCPDPWLPYEAHYDHIVTGRAAAQAFLSSGLPLYPRGTRTQPWQPKAIGFYLTAEPNTVIDVTRFFDRKFAAMALHSSQFSEDTLALYSLYFKKKGLELAEGKDFELGEGLKVLSPLHLHCFVDAGQV
ncbi:GlcNAc-PI de-N-acetylase [Paenibacillus helianthi]|uniref:GlcNAc-PI de-N-acetylase n=1 Tax=Paenibacillus helianthi TaxID=1349432 RepID=A0ABX3EHX5_9BACL|nr:MULTISPECIES: PIG-L deacetylase family protein [Paenibacillus]OKP81487.1 GlcNAc-PI de-N-acetylase [Paenibacillus helianthi]OKP82431.1 GlcNAc-PI de-N-acetylase [Paenibacillus sp. P3E]